MTKHQLKTWPEYFAATKQGTKRFEYRKNDRHFCAGDILVLQEWNPHTKEYSGEELRMRIRSIFFRLPDMPINYCIMDVESEK